jgi:hypothetical protein
MAFFMGCLTLTVKNLSTSALGIESWDIMSFDICLKIFSCSMVVDDVLKV